MRDSLEKESIEEKIVDHIINNFSVEVIYLYGSRARGRIHKESDWDIAILFPDYIPDILDRYSRPQDVEALLQRELKLYDKISVVDLEIVPPPLQFNIIKGKILYCKVPSRRFRIEHSIISKIEKDYYAR